MTKKQIKSAEKKRRIFAGEFKKRLEAGDPEAIKLWNDFVKDFKRESEPLARWWQKLEDNPDTARQLRYLEALSESVNPDWRRIGENIDIESFVEIMNRASDEAGRIELPASPEEATEQILRKKARELGITLNRLLRWNRLIEFKEQLLTVLQMSDRIDKAERTIRQDFHDMKKKGYYPK